MPSTPPPPEGAPSRSSEKRILQLQHAETWMRQCANRCRTELQLPRLAEMTTEDHKTAGRFFVREYLAMKDAQWDLPEGEAGIVNMQRHVRGALFFLNDEQEPDVAIRNEFMRHAMYAYRQFLVSPAKETLAPMQPSIDAVAQVFGRRVRDPHDQKLRQEYLATISSFGRTVAPNIAFESFGQHIQFHQSVSILMAKIDDAAKRYAGEPLDAATRNRVLTAILVGLETMRQNQPVEVAPDRSQAITDFTKKIRGKLDFPHQFPNEERSS